MKLPVPEGRYVVAVSGGVDSMALLDILAKQKADVVVAHFNHGIRQDSSKDEELVGKAAEDYQLPFEAGYGNLGRNASEEQARRARYKFLNSIKKKHNAQAIITAHHQDDLIETAILNTIRGTGRRGLTAISDNPDILRPLLHLSKNDILKYAKSHDLTWAEDPTNRDEKYLRNYIRQRIVPKLSIKQRAMFLEKLGEMAVVNRIIDQEIAKISQKIVKNNKIKRSGFINLPTEVGKEVLMNYLRSNDIRSFDKKNVDRLAAVIKTAQPGTKHDVTRDISLAVTASEAHLITPD